MHPPPEVQAILVCDPIFRKRDVGVVLHRGQKAI
jgi:hypothetical protein